MKMKRPAKHLHLFRDRYGKQRVYYRRPGKPAVSLPLPLYGEAFWIAYRAAEERSSQEAQAVQDTTAKPKVGQARQGSMSALIEAYYRSAEWRSLAASSRETYRRQLDHFRAEHGHRLVADLKTPHVNLIMDQMADRPAAANNLRDRLSTLMKYAMASGWREDNPVLFAKKVRHKTRGFRTWTEHDITAFRKRWPVGSPQRLAFEILLFTGLRRSDAVRLGPQHLKGGCHVIATKKSGDLVTLEIPLHPTCKAPGIRSGRPGLHPDPRGSLPIGGGIHRLDQGGCGEGGLAQQLQSTWVAEGRVPKACAGRLHRTTNPGDHRAPTPRRGGHIHPRGQPEGSRPGRDGYDHRHL
jgi:hypothetical protein